MTNGFCYVGTILKNNNNIFQKPAPDFTCVRIKTDFVGGANNTSTMQIENENEKMLKR